VPTAVSSCRRTDLLDGDGLSLNAFICAFVNHSAAITLFLNSIAGDTAQFADLTVFGKPWGKTSAKSDVADVRLILPQGTIMTVFDILISQRLLVFLENNFGQILVGAYLGGGKTTQPMEITSALQLAIDKGLDNESDGCIAQSDIQRFFDTLPVLLITLWLVNVGVCPRLVAPCVRHQFLFDHYDCL